MLKTFRISIHTIFRSNSFFLMMSLLSMGFFIASCSGSEPDSNNEGNSEPTEQVDNSQSAQDKLIAEGKGVGPVTSIEIPATIDKEMATKGHELFESKCTACHNSTDEKKVGPGLKGVTKIQKPEWIMNMILNPSEMLQKDPKAKELLGEYIAQMANQSLSEDEARNILEFLRENDSK